MAVEKFGKNLTLQLDSDRKLLIKAKPGFERELKRALKEIKTEARHSVRINHSKYSKAEDGKAGRLEKSIQVGEVFTKNRRLHGTVTAGSRLAPYANCVHDGTKAGIRRVRNPSKAFSFEWKGRTGTGYATGQYGGIDVDSARDSADPRTGGAGDFRLADFQYVRGKRKGEMKTFSERVPITLKPKKVMVKQVNHPGNKADPFLNNAAIKVIRKYGGARKQRDGTWRR